MPVSSFTSRRAHSSIDSPCSIKPARHVYKSVLRVAWRARRILSPFEIRIIIAGEMRGKTTLPHKGHTRAVSYLSSCKGPPQQPQKRAVLRHFSRASARAAAGAIGLFMAKSSRSLIHLCFAGVGAPSSRIAVV